MNDLQLSVIIPVYNRSSVVVRTLDSVKAQTYRPLRLILVDNESSDDSLFTLLHWSSQNQAEDFHIEVLSESVSGAAATRNAGLAVVDTPWVMFFDSDDYMHPNHIASAFDTLAKNPDADIVGWDVNLHTLEGKVVRKNFAKKDCLYNCVLDGTMATQRYMVRTSILRSVGGWNSSVLVWNDIELGTRLLQNTSLKIVKRRGNRYVDVYAGVDSITGTSYLDKCSRLEHALDVMCGNVPRRNRYIVLLKSAVLAGLYIREGGLAESDTLMSKILDSEASSKKRLLYKLARYYTSRGGRGTAKILKYFF